MIDLGEFTGADPAPPRPHGRPPRNRRAAAAVAALGLVALGGSARPAGPELRLAWSTGMPGVDMVNFSADNVYVSRRVDGRTEITAYDLATGRIAWTKSIAEPGLVHPEPAGSVVLLRLGITAMAVGADGNMISESSVRSSTIALDGATGAELWRAPGAPNLRHADQVLLEERDKAGHTDRLTLASIRGGSTIWSQATPGVRRWAATHRDGLPAEIVTFGDLNEVTVYRITDGSISHPGRLPAVAGEGGSVGGYVTANVTSAGTRRATTTVYRLHDLAPLWSVDTDDSDLTTCGPIFCRWSRDSGLAGMDPVTGRTLWQKRGVHIAREARGGNLAVSAGNDDSVTAAGANLFVFTESDDSMTAAGGDPPWAVLDTSSGRPLGTPGRGRLAWAPSGSAPTDSALVLRLPVAQRALTSVFRVDLTTGRSTLVGATDTVIRSNCFDLGPYMVCQGSDRLAVLAVGRQGEIG